jgi:hypothetical protein
MDPDSGAGFLRARSTRRRHDVSEDDAPAGEQQQRGREESAKGLALHDVLSSAVGVGTAFGKDHRQGLTVFDCSGPKPPRWSIVF